MIGLGKGAFGGGLAIIGVPLLALVTDPVDAAIIVAIVSSTTDVFAVKAFPMRTWSWPDIVWVASVLPTASLNRTVNACAARAFPTVNAAASTAPPGVTVVPV